MTPGGSLGGGGGGHLGWGRGSLGVGMVTRGITGGITREITTGITRDEGAHVL